MRNACVSVQVQRSIGVASYDAASFDWRRDATRDAREIGADMRLHVFEPLGNRRGNMLRPRQNREIAERKVKPGCTQTPNVCQHQ